MKLYVLMTIHNRAEYSLACLECVDAQTYRNFEIVVVDDGSTDGSSNRIQERYPGVTILKGDGNLWWTGGMNVGLRYILQKASKNDLVLTLNDDTWFDTDYFERLLQAQSARPGSCVGSLLKNYYDRSVVEDSGICIDWDGYWYKPIRYDEVNEVVEVDTLSCRGTVVPVSVFNKIGLFDQKKLPHYNADYDFFLRAARADVPLYMTYEAVIFNKEKLDGKKKQRSLWWRMFNRKSPSNISNNAIMIVRHSPGWYMKLKNILFYTARSLGKLF